MIKTFVNKVLPVCIAVVFILAAGQIIFSICNYDNMLTALPLHTMVILEGLLWGVIILAGIICYAIGKKLINK